MARPAWPAPMTTVVVCMGLQWLTVDRTVTLVGFVTMSKTADRFCDWATSASMSAAARVGVDREVDRDALEAVADVGIGAEHAEHVHVASSVAVTERSWMSRICATAATPAVRQPASPTRTNSVGVAP